VDWDQASSSEEFLFRVLVERQWRQVAISRSRGRKVGWACESVDPGPREILDLPSEIARRGKKGSREKIGLIMFASKRGTVGF